jgi:hypothetical protein
MGTSYTKEFDDITTATNASVIPGLFNQLLTDHPVYSELTAADNRMTSTFAQNRLEWKVRAGLNNSIKYFSTATAEVDLFDQEHMTTAWAEPALMGGAVVYTDVEKEQTEGRDGVISLQRVKMEALEDAFKEILSANLFGDGTGGTTMGLGAWVPVSPGTATVAHLSEATYDFWVPYYQGGAGAWNSFGYLTAGDKVITMLNTCADGSMQPDLLIMDQTTWERFHRSLAGKVAFHTNEAFGEIGKQSLRIWGKKLVWDKAADPNTLIALHSKRFKWVTSPSMNMRVSPTRYLERQPLVSYNFVVLRHQLICTQRNIQGRLDEWTD